ncbi:hypothetical protein AB0O91_04925 [Kitasatospora sp. NPDC089797]|uniref:hypothetical protein n=1 Tax=Kitasatospora sp. NPDC089797 TaxID=3155298 RepID=UPI00343368B1
MAVRGETTRDVQHEPARQGRHGRPRPFGGRFRLPTLRFSGAAMAMSTVVGISIATTLLLNEQQGIGRRAGVARVGTSPPPSPGDTDQAETASDRTTDAPPPSGRPRGPKAPDHATGHASAHPSGPANAAATPPAGLPAGTSVPVTPSTGGQASADHDPHSAAGTPAGGPGAGATAAGSAAAGTVGPSPSAQPPSPAGPSGPTTQPGPPGPSGPSGQPGPSGRPSPSSGSPGAGTADADRSPRPPAFQPAHPVGPVGSAPGRPVPPPVPVTPDRDTDDPTDTGTPTPAPAADGADQETGQETGRGADRTLTGTGLTGPVGRDGLRHALDLTVTETVTALQAEFRLAPGELATGGGAAWTDLPGAVVTTQQERGTLVYRFTTPPGTDVRPGRYGFVVRGSRPADLVGQTGPLIGPPRKPGPQESWNAAAFGIDHPRAVAALGGFGPLLPQPAHP